MKTTKNAVGSAKPKKVVKVSTPEIIEPTINKFVSVCNAPIQFGYVNLSRIFPNAIPRVIRFADIQVLCEPSVFESIEKLFVSYSPSQTRCSMALYFNALINDVLQLVEKDHFAAEAKTLSYIGYMDSIDEYGEPYEVGSMHSYQISLWTMHPIDTTRILLITKTCRDTFVAFSDVRYELALRAQAKYQRPAKE